MTFAEYFVWFLFGLVAISQGAVIVLSVCAIAFRPLPRCNEGAMATSPPPRSPHD